MKKIRSKYVKINYIKVIFLILLFTMLYSCSSEPEVTINITIPKVDTVQNLNTNYYKLWLEDQTGYNIVFNEVSGAYEQDYLAETLSDENIKTDIIFFGGLNEENTLIPADDVFQMTEYFYPIDEFITSDTNLYNIFDMHAEEEWQDFLSNIDGKLYFAPSANPSRSAKNGQSIWINTAWLTNLGLDIPTTISEFEYVLNEFSQRDANNNGIRDEIPLAGSMENDDTMVFNAIINSFIYYDTANYGFYYRDNDLVFSPKTQDFRSALVYLHSLYQQDILHPLQFELDGRGLTALATDPADLLGAFSASHLSDVFTESDYTRFSHFTQLAPFSDSSGHSVPQLTVPAPAVAISANTQHPEEAFKLIDLMYSEEAFLIAYYGKEGVDWQFAEPTDVDIFGEVAKIATINHLSGTMQNKNFDSIGVLYYYPDYVDGVRYTDFDIGYFNARALLANEPYFAPQEIGLSILKIIKDDKDTERQFNDLSEYTNQYIIDFTTGKIDIYDESTWTNYVEGYDNFSEIFDAVENEIAP